ALLYEASYVRSTDPKLFAELAERPAGVSQLHESLAVEDLLRSAERFPLGSGSGQSCLGPENQTLPFLLGKTADDGNQYIPQHRYWTFAVEPRLSHGFILNVPAVQCVKEVQRLPRTHAGYTVKFPDQNVGHFFSAARIQQCA